MPALVDARQTSQLHCGRVRNLFPLTLHQGLLLATRGTACHVCSLTGQGANLRSPGRFVSDHGQQQHSNQGGTGTGIEGPRSGTA